jgi:protocadherin Fat 1/2/3
VNVTSCGKNRRCNIVNPMTFSGESYAEYIALRSIERHLSVSLSLKTRSPSGNIMFARGAVDYSVLEVSGGMLRYRFDFGSGEGSVTLSGVRVDDGEWHEVSREHPVNNRVI